MEIAYWIIAALLCALYIFSGTKKLSQSADQLRPMMGWVDTVPMSAVRGIGAVEVLGAIGLVLPPLTDILPELAIAAAVGLVVLQIGAAALHLSRGEGKQVPLNLVLILAAAAAGWLGTAFL